MPVEPREDEHGPGRWTECRQEVDTEDDGEDRDVLHRYDPRFTIDSGAPCIASRFCDRQGRRIGPFSFAVQREIALFLLRWWRSEHRSYARATAGTTSDRVSMVVSQYRPLLSAIQPKTT